MPAISIQICCYNSEKYLDETIKSVLLQTFKDWELIIVNDGSTDATEAIIKEYIHKDAPIVYFYQKNKGFAAARNKALGLSRGDWVAILDHDDLWYPEKLEIQNKSTEKYPSAKLHFSNSEWFNNNGRIVRKTIEHQKFRTGLMLNSFLKLIVEGCFIDSETVLMDRQALIDCGGFNEHYRYIVDYDMCMRLAYKYDIIYYEDRVLAKWRMHPRQATQIMQEIMYREYIELFEDILKKYNLTNNVERHVKNVIVSNAVKYSLVQLRNKKIKDFIMILIKKVGFVPMTRFIYTKALRVIYQVFIKFIAHEAKND